ncbi:protein MAINTENANCE OF MERISTEMS-like [Papaver somniferum]|uniref:protein MAINTENANCE OF MERISTEMS-like n=1 Tax=Papaver somniferum TaxID=3469 RepID=UPI000E705044|nr:protein MAINTENANCE OF MERISTEMS-like [Papaver somniferum]
MITPTSKAHHHDKYLLAGPLRGKKPSEVSFSITEPRDIVNELSDSSESDSPVISANSSGEEDEIQEDPPEEDEGDDAGDKDDEKDEGNDAGDKEDEEDEGKKDVEAEEENAKPKPDHKNVARLFRHQSSFKKMELWPLAGECARVRDYVENSGLYNAVVNSVIAYDKVAVSSLCERYYAEVDTFQLPFGEMALTPDDAEQILGLQVEGTKYAKKKFKLVEIRNMFSRTEKKEKDKGLSDMECRYAAAAYLLYVLASVVSPDNKGNRVSANLLQLLDPLEDVKKYSWGTPIVAHLNGQLSQASRERTSQINGNLALIQVWIYDHFPSLFKDNEDVELNPDWIKGSPTGTRWLFTGSQDKEQTDALIEMRQKLDNITAKKVIFTSYKDDRVGAMEDVMYYYGPLFHLNGFSMYNPMRIMRQLGFIQDSPNDDYVPSFKHKLDKCQAGKSDVVG